MALTPVELPPFNGLDLRDDAQQVGAGAAVDLLNVDLSQPGRLRSRDGYADFTSAAAARYRTIYRYVTSTGTQFLASSRATAVDMVSSTGTVSFTQASTWGGSGHAFCRYGTPTAERLYFVSSDDTLRYYQDGGTFGTASGSPPAGYMLAAQQPDNRLVVAAQQANLSRVQFSGAGDPNSWTATDYVDLAPGDGEIITGLVSWRELLFVFKNSRFWVFTGNATTSTGSTIFTNHSVDAGIGTASTQYAACAGEEGVYFINARGVYLTTGGTPVKISQALEPFFTGSLDASWQGGTPSSSLTDAVLSYANGRLYVALTTSVGRRVFVYYNGQWTMWDLPAWQFATLPISNVETLMFSYASGTNKIGKFSSASTTDAGSSISWRYRTGFWNPGQPAAESVVREWLIDGTGTVNVKTAVNDGSLGSSASVTLGTSPAVAQGRDRRAVRGRNVSLELSGTSAASVSRVVANLRGQRNVGLKAT